VCARITGEAHYGVGSIHRQLCDPLHFKLWPPLRDGAMCQKGMQFRNSE
jgi:hypothetical protein